MIDLSCEERFADSGKPKSGINVGDHVIFGCRKILAEHALCAEGRGDANQVSHNKLFR